MTPEYLEELAQLADPDNLWKLAGLDQLKLPVEDRVKLDTAVALRRYAKHLAYLNQLRATRRSLLITPLESNSTAIKSVKTPPDHERLRQRPAKFDETSERINPADESWHF